MASELAISLTWNEPERAASSRGWLFRPGETRSLGFYLDYGPNHYRSPHSITRPSDGKVLTFCEPSSDRATEVCPSHQPGSVLAVVVDGPSRYVETVEDARRWIESKVS
jgi:hypothetical protein